MWLLKHFLISLLPTAVIFYFSRLGALIFILVNILVDSDHYPVYVWKFKDLSLKKAHKYFKSLKECKNVALFHSFEFIIFILIVSFFYKILFFVFLGLIFHLTLDIYDVYDRGIKRYFSLINWLRKEIIKK